MIGPLCRLVRLRLALMNGVAATGGYLLFTAAPEPLALCALFAGVSLLAAAGSALNQVLERDLDAVMLRTRTRPLPSGEFRLASAVSWGAACALAGGLLLSSSGSTAAPVIGVAALAWYLAVYTPLKRRSSLAVLAGALAGAAPPVIGWCFAGGDPSDFRVVVVAGIFYLWQVPHFWLLQRRHAEDYRRAGFPLFELGPDGRGSVWLCRLWIVALLGGSILLPALGLVGRAAATCLSCVIVGALFLLTCTRMESALFAGLNLFPLLVTVSLSVR